VGRLFWKFFLSFLLAQLTATVGIGGAIWLKNRSQLNSVQVALDTSPPAEMAINAAAATLEYGGVKALRRMLENMERHRVYAVDEQEQELLGRVVAPSVLKESRARLKEEGKRRVVRQVSDPDGKRYLLFLPSGERQRGIDAGTRPLLAGIGGAQMAMQASVIPGSDERRGPNPQDGRNRPPPPPDGMPPANPGPQGDLRGPGGPNDPGMQGDRRDMGGDQRGPWGPRFQPLTPWVPIAAATLASLLFSVLLAWYFSRPIRALRQAFAAAAGGDAFGKRHAMLALVLAAAVLVRGLADFVAFEEQHLRAAFAGVDLGRQRRGVRELQRHIAFPFRLERRHVDDDAAARIGRLAQADRQHVARNAEVLDGAGQRERVRRDDADVAFDVDEGIRIEVLRVDDGAVDVREDLEFVGAADVVAVRRGAPGDDLAAVRSRAPVGRERLDHAVFLPPSGVSICRF
jgi:hypothetical protein